MTQQPTGQPQADVRLYTPRASYSFSAAREVFKRSPVAHAAFVHPGDAALEASVDGDAAESSANGSKPANRAQGKRRKSTVMNEPLIVVIVPADANEDEGEVDPDDLDQWVAYFHTHAHSGLVEAVERGSTSITATTTLIDGLVFSPTAHDHSLNYRSATLHLHSPVVLGADTPIPSAAHEEKRHALAIVTDVVTSYARIAVVGQPTDPNVKRTTVVRCRLGAVSVKQRAGGFNSFKEPELQAASEEEADQGWTGVAPCWTAWGDLVGYGKDGDEVKKMLAQRTLQGKREAEASAWASEGGRLEGLGKKRGAR